jgi:hypothetical protein
MGGFMNSEIVESQSEFGPRREHDAQHAIAEIVDVTRPLGLSLPEPWKSILGRNAKSLLQVGTPWEVVIAAATISIMRSKPEVMQYIAGDLMVAYAGLRMSRREYERKLDDLNAEHKPEQMPLFAAYQERKRKREEDIHQQRRAGH